MHDAAPTVEKYAAFHRLLHWLMAVLIVGMIAAGWVMTDLAREDPLRDRLFGLHFSFGVTVFALALLRVLVRLTTRTPALPVALAGWERSLAAFTHLLMYLSMLLLPVFGYLTAGSAPGSQGVSVFGLFRLPPLLQGEENLHDLFEALHGGGAWLLAVLIVLHVGGVLKHRFLDGPGADVLSRML